MRLICLICCCLAVAAAAERSILFIGNSLTYYNDLPATVASVAAAHGVDIHCEKVAVGGKSLEWHWQEGQARKRLQARPWTWVVLQDKTSQPTRRPAKLQEFGRRFIDAARAQRSRPVLYMTWPSKGHMDDQTVVRDAYLQLAADADAECVPVGVAFDRYRRRHGDTALFCDDRHPTPAGTYLVACMFTAWLCNTKVGRPSSASRELDAETVDEIHALVNDLRRQVRRRRAR